jgi:hypothetical protein
MRGGCGVYDPRKALLALERDENVAAVWLELFGELHHQGDVGEASFAAVPHLVRIHAARGVPDWNTYALVFTIEECRENSSNPTLPQRLRQAYEDAWRHLAELGLREIATNEDPLLIRCAMAVIAQSKGQRAIAKFAMSTKDEQKKMLATMGIEL